MHAYRQARHTYRHTYIETYRHTDIHTDIQTYRHTDIQTRRHTDTQTHRHTVRQTYTQTHRHTDKQTYIRMYVQPYLPVFRLHSRGNWSFRYVTIGAMFVGARVNMDVTCPEAVEQLAHDTDSIRWQSAGRSFSGEDGAAGFRVLKEMCFTFCREQKFSSLKRSHFSFVSSKAAGVLGAGS